jgi:hypothetical protein
MPGKYTIRLKINGETQEQVLQVRMDPRVKTSQADLQKQHDMSLQCYVLRQQSSDLITKVKAFRENLKTQLSSATGEKLEKLKATDKALAELESPAPGSKIPGFNRLPGTFAGLFGVLQDADLAPTSQAAAGVAEAVANFNSIKAKFEALSK